MAPWWLRESNDERPVDSPAELEAFAGEDDFLDANQADEVDDSTIIATVSLNPVLTAAAAKADEVAAEGQSDGGFEGPFDDEADDDPSGLGMADEEGSEPNLGDAAAGSAGISRKRRRRRRRRPTLSADSHPVVAPLEVEVPSETFVLAANTAANTVANTTLEDAPGEETQASTVVFEAIAMPPSELPPDRPRIATPVPPAPATTNQVATVGLPAADLGSIVAEPETASRPEVPASNLGPEGSRPSEQRKPLATPQRRHESRRSRSSETRSGESREARSEDRPRGERGAPPRAVINPSYSRPEPTFFQPTPEGEHLADLGKTVVYTMHERPAHNGDERKIAMFVDFENIALGVRDSEVRTLDITLILERLLEKGKIIVKKAYADWERYSDFKRPFHEAAIELIDIPQKFYSGKNSADIKMVVDAMDLCYSKEHLDTFVLVSGDSDFSPLVSKLKENNKYVIGLGVKNSSSHLLIDNCDEFIYYEDVWRDAQRVPRLDHLQPKETECFQLLCEAIVALLRENKDVLWGSLVKQTMQRKRPSFNEGYFGYSTFTELLEDAERKGIIRMRRDQRSGTHIVVGFAPRSKR